MLLFYDTETTGFMNSRKPVDHPSQAHLVQLAAQLVTLQDETVMEFSMIVDPGVEIPKEASDIHGITTDKAKTLGFRPKTAVSMFEKLHNLASARIAHNISFDDQVMATAFARHYGEPYPLNKPAVCTMRNATKTVGLPPTERMRAAGRHHNKAPNLTECMRFFFDEDLVGAHDAKVDVVGCRRVFFELVNRSVIELPNTGSIGA